MSWWTEFSDRVERDVPLGRETWFRLGGTARIVFRPSDEPDLMAFLHTASAESVPVKVLGRGANVLISDEGFDGAVIRLDAPAFCSVTVDGTQIVAGAGVDLIPLARRMSAAGLTGLEPMAGIPATVGGALRMNAGGAGGEFGDVVVSARVVDETGNAAVWDRGRLGLGYRQSGLGDHVVVSVALRLAMADPGRTMSRFNKFDAMKRRSQPIGAKSAGCMFKNPPGHSAGALIDRAGLKGTRCGGASVSQRHANFIVAEASANAGDVIRLIDIVRERVRREFDVDLELEVDVWHPQRAESLA